MGRSHDSQVVFVVVACYTEIAIAASTSEVGMSHHQLDYRARMREGGFRVTPQRQLILDAICEGGGHTTLPEIYERVQAKAPDISRATVYRALDFFCQLGLVVAADIGGEHTVYEIAGTTRHHHLACRQCGQVEQVDPDIMEALFTQIEGEQGFKVDMDHVVLLGTCKRCLAASKKKTGRRQL
jgi:Fur family ferric uptake transcriptional regulator